VVSAVPVLSWLVALIAAGIGVARGPRPVAWRFAADRLLHYLILFPVGVMGLWAALGHLVFPAESAQAIGWAQSPFQSEVGSANLGIGWLDSMPRFVPTKRGLRPRSWWPAFSAGPASCTSTISCAPAISRRAMPDRSCSPIS
jgi:Family of unknown function (DUF6790)